MCEFLKSVTNEKCMFCTIASKFGKTKNHIIIFVSFAHLSLSLSLSLSHYLSSMSQCCICLKPSIICLITLLIYSRSNLLNGLPLVCVYYTLFNRSFRKKSRNMSIYSISLVDNTIIKKKLC